MTTPPPHEARTVRILIATIAVLLGVVAALVSGILLRLDGNTMPQTILYGCGTFAATVLFAFALFHFLSGSRTGNDDG